MYLPEFEELSENELNIEFEKDNVLYNFYERNHRLAITKMYFDNDGEQVEENIFYTIFTKEFYEKAVSLVNEILGE